MIPDKRLTGKKLLLLLQDVMILFSFIIMPDLVHSIIFIRMT